MRCCQVWISTTEGITLSSCNLNYVQNIGRINYFYRCPVCVHQLYNHCVHNGYLLEWVQTQEDIRMRCGGTNGLCQDCAYRIVSATLHAIATRGPINHLFIEQWPSFNQGCKRQSACSHGSSMVSCVPQKNNLNFWALSIYKPAPPPFQ